jgi:hypothetical protein
MSFRTFLWILLLLAFAFGLGYGPKELERRRLVEGTRITERDLQLATLERQLGVAALEAQRNNYGTAGTAARAFFEGCRATTTGQYDLSDLPRTRLALTAFAGSSDAILGQLALADPAVKDRLAALYLTMDGLIQRRQ